jgi:predicted class III extradiol MEMO1 family dioxygenase
MEAVIAARGGWTSRFLRYAQSSRCRQMTDSSVSYAAAVVTAPVE